MSLCLAIFVLTINTISALEVTNMQVEYLTNPLGLDTPTPRFTWELTSDAALRTLASKSYRLRVWNRAQLYWDTGDVWSNRTSSVRYSGPKLQSGVAYTWFVVIWTTQFTLPSACTVCKDTSRVPLFLCRSVSLTSNGGVTVHSDTSTFSMGLLSKADWTGSFIGMESGNGAQVHFELERFPIIK